MTACAVSVYSVKSYNILINSQAQLWTEKNEREIQEIEMHDRTDALSTRSIPIIYW